MGMKRLNNMLIFLWLPLFAKDPYTQGRYYATPVANVDSNIPDKHVPS